MTHVGIAVDEVKFFPDADTLLVWFSNRKENCEIRFSDENYFVKEVVNFPYIAKLNTNYLIADLDYDGLDEIVFVISESFHTELRVLDLDAENKIIQKKIAGFETDDEHYNGGLSFALSDSILVIAYSTFFPKRIASRGIYSVNRSDYSVNWYYPTAEYIDKNIQIIHGAKEEIILFGTAGVSNGMHASGGVFYAYEDDVLFRGKRFENVTEKNIPVLYSGNSADTSASLYALNMDGKLLWKKRIGGANVWAKTEKIVIDGKEYAATAPLRRKDTESKYDTLYIFNPDNGALFDKYSLSGRLKQLFKGGDNLWMVIKGKEILKFDTKNKIVNSFIEDDRIANIIDYIGQTEKFVLYYLIEGIGLAGEDCDVHSVLMREGFFKYLPSLKLLSYIHFDRKVITLYSLEEVPWLLRQSAKTYLVITGIILSFFIFALVMWLVQIRKSHKAISAKNIQLEEKQENIDKLTADLVHSEKLAMLGMVIGSIAHEINSPLGAVSNGIKRGIKHLDDIELSNKNFDLALKAADKCKLLVDKLLYSIQKKGEHFGSANLLEAWNEWYYIFGNRFEMNDVILDVNIPDDINVSINVSDLHQALGNILMNSLESVLGAGRSEKKINIVAKNENMGCFIRIEDNGGGFPGEVLSNPATPFHTIGKGEKGTGLGLWLVKNIVDNHGGQIKFGNTGDGAFVELILKTTV